MAGFGFGATGGFGQTSTPFGQTSTPFRQQQPQATPFGQSPASQPAFGAAATPFGAASTPAFGASPAPAFGASPFGGGAASTPAFGASNTNVFGAPKPAGFGFGAPAANSNPFGAPASQPSAFGASAFGAPASAPSAFGAPAASPFGGGAAAATPAFGGATGSAFGAPAASPAGGAFGQATPSFGGFGAAAPAAGSPFGGSGAPAGGGGTRVAPYAKHQESDTNAQGTRSTMYLMSITAMPAYVSKSVDELRWEDYQAGVTSGAGQQQAAPGGFGAPAAAGGFGAAASTPAFGAGGFGAASTPAFGAAASTPAFGAAPFGTPASSPSPFGGGAATGGGLFGAAASTPAFGGGFGTPAASTPAFGAAASTPAFGGGFGTPAASTPAFGAPASSPSPFGAAPASSSAFSFAQASTPAFGAATASAFGAAAPAAPGGGLFGNAAAQQPRPAFGGGLFGATPASSAAAFSFASTPAFGAAAPAGGGGLFGAASSAAAFSFASTPAFGAAAPAGGGLFGAAQTAAAGGFSLVPQGAPVAAPGINTSPYGVLPEPPKVAAAPAVKVGLTQRPTGAQLLNTTANGSPRVASLLTPRSLSPASGVRMRARRARTPVAATSVGVFASPLGGGPAAVSGPPPRSTGTPVQSSVFVPRDNPRALFIRDPLPSTEPAGGGDASVGHRRNGTMAGGHSEEEEDGHEDGGVMSDEALRKVLPVLNRADYYCEPSIKQLASMAREDPALLRRVGGFVIGRKGYGSVRYRQPVDVRRLVLDDIVRFDSIGTVEVYPEGVVHPKPPVGEGLNRPAEVTLLRVFKKDRDTGAVVRDPAALDKFVRRLKKATAEQGARFVGYEADEGAWTFVVEHFSKYGLCGDDDGDSDVSDTGSDWVEVTAAPGAESMDQMSEGDAAEQERRGEEEEEEEEEGGHELDVVVEDVYDGWGEDMPSHQLALVPTHTTLPPPAQLLDLKDALFTTPPPPPQQQAPPHTQLSHEQLKQQPPITPWSGAQPPPPCAPTTPLLPDVPTATASHTLLDAGLMLGCSFRVGWAPNNTLIMPKAVATHRGAPAATWALCRVSPDRSMGTVMEGGGGMTRQPATSLLFYGVDSAAAEEQQERDGGDDAMKYVRAALDLHRAHSRQVQHPATRRVYTLDSLAAAIDAHVLCIGQHVDRHVDHMSELSLELLRHAGETMELIKVLFAPTPSTEPRLSDMQRRAMLHRWLRDRARPLIDATLQNASSPSHQDTALTTEQQQTPSTMILQLLTGFQLAAATAAAAAVGDVRLATLLPQVGRTEQLSQCVAAQLDTWVAHDMLKAIDPQRLLIYKLLAGDVDAVVAAVPLDWRRAFALQLWYGGAASEAPAVALGRYVAAVQGKQAPVPAPRYAERLGIAVTEDVYDRDFCLLQLACGSGGGGDSGTQNYKDQLLAALLRPQAATPHVLGGGVQSWLVSELLVAAGAMDANSPLRTSVAMDAIAQLMCHPHMQHWAVYVALHLDDQHVAESLAARVVEWTPAQRAWLVDEVGVPEAWVVRAGALVGAQRGTSVSAIEQLCVAEEWDVAHDVLMRNAAWMVLAHGGVQGVLSLVGRMEGKVDAWAWARGGGVLQRLLGEHDVARDAAEEFVRTWGSKEAVAFWSNVLMGGEGGEGL